MSRNRLAVVVGLLLAFIVVAGYFIYTNESAGGKRVTFNVTVTGGTSISQRELDVQHNDFVTINITSDTTGEVHLHGYDIAFNCTAGKITSHTFTADKTGTFDIEWESTSTHLANLVVTP